MNDDVVRVGVVFHSSLACFQIARHTLGILDKGEYIDSILQVMRLNVMVISYKDHKKYSFMT